MPASLEANQMSRTLAQMRGDGVPILAGWRRDVLDPDFLALLTGRMAVAIDPNTRKVRLVPVR